MVKARSPRYPGIGLGEAVEKVGMVYKEDYQNELPREVIAEHMGYASLNGKSLSVLAALSQYGLLEGRGDATRVSDLALKILVSEEGSADRREAIRDASNRPELFRQLRERFPDGATDKAIRSFLLMQRFIPTGAEAVLRSFRETEEFLKSEGALHEQALEERAIKTLAPPEATETSEVVVGEKIEGSRISASTTPPRITIDDDSIIVEGGRIASTKQLERIIRLLEANSFVLDEDE